MEDHMIEWSGIMNPDSKNFYDRKITLKLMDDTGETSAVAEKSSQTPQTSQNSDEEICDGVQELSAVVKNATHATYATRVTHAS